MSTKAYAAQSATSPLAPFTLTRRAPLPTDVAIDVLYCGVCHTDLHQARDEWRGTSFPCVPGHEIVGRVARVGSAVTKFKKGDLAAVGCMIDSCRSCPSCEAGLEQYCEDDAGPVFTYNSPDKHSGGMTFGGYSEHVVVDESFVLRVSEKADLAATAPLLCAGITTYSPLKRWKVGPGKVAGIVGVGGLGHMGIKLARAFGARVVAFTTSTEKAEDARRLGAHETVVSTDADAMAGRANSLDFVLDCVSASHDVAPYLRLLKRDGALVLVGAPAEPLSVEAHNLINKRRQFSGSMIGGIAETQEMLDFCAERGIACDVETIKIQEVEDAYARLLRGDVRYRFVIDMASLRGSA